jgi:1,6-anhydro-N-acetylmuramate kinase
VITSPAKGTRESRTDKGQRYFTQQRTSIRPSVFEVTCATWSLAATNSSTVTASRPAHCDPKASLTHSACVAPSTDLLQLLNVCKLIACRHNTVLHRRAMEVPLQQQVAPPANPLPAAPDDEDVLRLRSTTHI